MTVDSEAIFALVNAEGPRAKVLEELRGSMAAAWLDERMRDTLFIARGVGRPLWLGEGKKEVFFASTKDALEVVERYVGLRLRKRELPEGILLSLGEGRRIGADRFTPDRAFEEHAPAGRARAGRGRVLPEPPCGDRRRPVSRPSGDTSTPSSRSRSRTRNWNVAHAPPPGSSMR